MTLAQHLWRIGLKRKVEVEGIDRHTKWGELSDGNHEAWDVIASYVTANGFKRPRGSGVRARSKPRSRTSKKK